MDSIFPHPSENLNLFASIYTFRMASSLISCIKSNSFKNRVSYNRVLYIFIKQTSDARTSLNQSTLDRLVTRLDSSHLSLHSWHTLCCVNTKCMFSTCSILREKLHPRSGSGVIFAPLDKISQKLGGRDEPRTTEVGRIKKDTDKS